MEKVSIIIPCYNLEGLIKKCVTSVMKQTYSNLEIIIINDGSTDKSEQVCQRLVKKDKRIILINNKISEGVEKARIDGINISKGNYIMSVDGDDYIEKTAVEKLLNQMKKKDSDIVIGNTA